jgi:hypothetical protein
MADEQAQPQSNYRLRIKIGTAEFDAEGPEQTVKEQFDMFLKTVQAAPLVPPVNTPAANVVVPPLDIKPGADPEIPTDITGRVYAERDGLVTLRMLPRGDNRDADALVLLLYGFQIFKGLTSVTAVSLAKAARISGLGLDRIDRSMLAHKQYVNEAGAKRGKQYSLNNQGLAFAKTLVVNTVQ